MGSGGLQFDAGDVLSSSRLNIKTFYVGTGAQIAAIASPTTYQIAICNSTGSGFTAGTMYYYNGAAWKAIGALQTDLALQFNAQQEIRFADSDSSNYVGFKAPATVGTNKIWTLPNADGTANYALITDGAGNLSWNSIVSLSGSDTLTNKNINLSNNTVTDTSIAGEDLAKSNGTKFVRFAKGSNYNFLRVNGSGNLEYDEIMGNELGRATGGAANSFTVSSLTAKLNLWVYIYTFSGTAAGADIQFNSDTGSNYSYRYSKNGAADTTGTSAAFIRSTDTVAEDTHVFLSITNTSSHRKLIQGTCVTDGGGGATVAPSKYNFVGKWDNTASQITSITVKATAAGNYTSGSYIIVYGMD